MDLLRFIVMCGMVCCISCSIKEDRDVCPCVLKLDLGDVDTAVVKVADLFLYGPGGYAFSRKLDVVDCGDIYEISVPRGEIKVLIHSGVEEEKAGTDGLEIPYGEDCPPVYMHASQIHASGESVSEKIDMRKEHCVLTVHVRSEESFPFSLDFKGGVDGFGVDGMPSEGMFSYSVSLNQDYRCDVVLPRQTDDSLLLEISDGSEVVKVFALGEYIAAAGYDWDERNLRDLTIGIDFILSQFSVVVQEWDEVIIYDVEI